jgi:peptidyl-prolyl cis-trans isomerase C
MSETRKILAAAAVALATALPVQAQEELAVDSVVATVNGTEITVGHMLMVRAGLPEQYQQLPDAALWDGILHQLVQQEVLAQSAEGEETRRTRIALENEERALRAAEAITSFASTAVTEERVQAAYEEQYVNGDLGMEYSAAHILVETEEEAAAIVTELENGADFAETAKAKSTGPSGPNGGDLGWFGAGMMVAPFQEAVEAMEPGEISAPVETQFGWHVIKLNETRATEAPELEAVRGQIEQGLQQSLAQTHIEGLVAEAEVDSTTAEEVDPSILSNLTLLED